MTPEQPKATRAITAVLAWLGSFPAILLSVALVGVWACLGPLMGWSDTWQLLINTPTTVITFWMAFVILNAQNRDSRAIQTKLDAIVKAIEEVDDSVAGIEDLPEGDIREKQEAVREQN